MIPAGTAETRARRIFEALQAHPGGLTRQGIQSILNLNSIDPQVIRRMLVQLVERGAVRVEGQTKARKYYPGPEPGLPVPLFQEARPAPEAPAEYRWSDLTSYQPNETWLLPHSERERLADPGVAGPRPGRSDVNLDLVWDALRLEGGTFTRPDLPALLARGQPPPPRDPAAFQLLLNLQAAVAFLQDPAREAGVDAASLCNLSALVTENLLADPAEEGRLRTGPMVLAGPAYRPPAEPAAIAGAFRRLVALAARVADPFEQAFLLLAHLPCLQPFPAGNLATALLAAQIPLVGRGLPPFTFPDLPTPTLLAALRAVQEQGQPDPLRDLFLAACARARAHGRERAPAVPDPFRLRYRADLRALVRAVVQAGESPTAAERRIQAHAQARLPREDRDGYREAAAGELAALHDGNFARYGLRPAEFAAWKASQPPVPYRR
jgi:hypothetical protein